MIAVTCIAFFSACSTNNVVATADPDADFGAYKTYNFAPVLDTDGKEYESLESNYLKKAVGREMQARGFSLDSNPDLLVNFSIETEEKIRTRSVPTAGYGAGYDPYYDVYYDDWGAHHETRIDSYTEGKLNIDFIDPALRKMVWQGSTKGRLTQQMMADAEVTLNEAAAEIFEVFPVKKPEAE